MARYRKLRELRLKLEADKLKLRMIEKRLLEVKNEAIWLDLIANRNFLTVRIDQTKCKIRNIEQGFPSNGEPEGVIYLDETINNKKK